MKKFLKSAAIAVVLSIPVLSVVLAATRYAGDALFSETALAYSKTSDTLNTDNLSNLSFQAVYSSYVPVAKTVFDGSKSTMTVSVSSNSALSATKATVQFNFISASTNAYVGAIITINGTTFRQGAGKEWQIATTATGTAVNLAAAIDANSTLDAVAVSSTVFTTATVAGVYANTWAVATSTPTVLSTSSVFMVGGRDNARLAINGVVFDAGNQFNVAATSSGTAKAISDAIMADNRINTLITSTWTMIVASSIGVVNATATAVGVNAYSIFTSTPLALQVNGSSLTATSTFLNGLASDVVSNTFTKSNHGFTTGLDLLFATVAGTPPQNLVSGTTYFAIRDSASTFRLATTRANATATTPTAITVSTVTGLGSFTLTPLALTGTPTCKMQISNDNTNWTDLGVNSISFASPYTSTSTIWDLGTPAYRYYRFSYTLGTTGGVAISITASGRSN